ncbi:MAG TPA: PHP domain-containing protein [Pseudonocardiaceae bacterium]|nr:PHP domain-containing protein [Pseudonocardiaceae bacterium]
MGHHHPHDHDGHDAALPPALDLSIPDDELPPADSSRRSFLRRAGALGAAAVAAGTLGPAVGQAAAEPDDGPGDGPRPPKGGFQWLAGDHHIHTQYSPDAQYRVIDQVRHAHAYGLDWMVITDHGSAQHAKIGVEKVNPDIVAARAAIPEILVFQGLEWNIPAAEHGTVFVHPGPNEVAVLKEFENVYDGVITNTGASTPANEALATAGITFLASAVTGRRVTDALMLANHPARKGIDSPHEIRAWRDASPAIAIGMEGAPGHQAAGIAMPGGPGSGRGAYDNSPTAASFPGYPLESYRTFGGYDWMTATVGGLWDSLLAEGKPWWITANSDAHMIYGDTSTRGPGSDFTNNGFFNDPVHGGPANLTNSDFWPGFYSRTNVGTRLDTYAAVMDGLRAGRIWVDHGQLISALDMQLSAAPGRSAPLGGTLQVRRGAPVILTINIDLANGPNWAQFQPTLARVDVIAGDITGPVTDQDTFTTPATKVVKSFDIGRNSGSVSLSYSFTADKSFYVRIRGTDGNRGAPGLLGVAIDPAGPAMDVLGDADPWKDLWFYSNPIFVLVR